MCLLPSGLPRIVSITVSFIISRDVQIHTLSKASQHLICFIDEMKVSQKASSISLNHVYVPTATSRAPPQTYQCMSLCSAIEWIFQLPYVQSFMSNKVTKLDHMDHITFAAPSLTPTPTRKIKKISAQKTSTYQRIVANCTNQSNKGKKVRRQRFNKIRQLPTS